MARRGSGVEFREKTRVKLLLWCDRHCCLCREACGLYIELHHIVPVEKGGTNDEDNAIPLCLECHGTVGHYNSRQPQGSKYGEKELKRRREQVYDEYTRHLVPLIRFHVLQELPKTIAGEPTKRGHRGHRELKPLALPSAGFLIRHEGTSLPVGVRITVNVYADGKKNNHSDRGAFDGKTEWNLNPGVQVEAPFLVSKSAMKAKRLAAHVRVTIIDELERKHALLPVLFRYQPEEKEWMLDPNEDSKRDVS